MLLKIHMQISRHRHDNKSSSHVHCEFFYLLFSQIMRIGIINSSSQFALLSMKMLLAFLWVQDMPRGWKNRRYTVINSLHETPFKAHIVMPLTLMPRWWKNRRYTVINSLHETPCKAHIVIRLTLKGENTMGILLTPC